MSTHLSQPSGSKKALLAMSLSALGVVFGDIGTSPLYSINEIFFGHAHVHREPFNVIGAISVVIWALTLIVMFKYILFVLRADNDGEGGVFALYSILINKIKKNKFTIIVASVLVFAAGLLYGDGIITPAISVISAVEGVGIMTPTLKDFIVPITIAILVGLFSIQRFGTHKVGKLFGPIVIIWFVSIGVLGVVQIIQHFDILQAINPVNAINFIVRTPVTNLMLILGSVMLVVTGGEAMYADMGHFGAKPIKLSWTALVYPALLLNYLGQGAYLLGPDEVHMENVFYSIVPTWALPFMVVIATFATIIASQALISGAFSLTSQAVSLGLLPKVAIKHTNSEHHGQIYIPVVNWMLLFGCVALVIAFKSSGNLASAYGLAVSGIMVMTTVAVAIVSVCLWKWNIVKTLLIFLPFGLIESSFLIANTMKIVQGGWIPLTIAMIIYYLMIAWNWGKTRINKAMDNNRTLSLQQIINYKKLHAVKTVKPSIFLTSFFINNASELAPAVLEEYYKRYGTIPYHTVLLNINQTTTPYVEKKNRYSIFKLFESEEYGTVVSVRVNLGFMEDNNVEKIVEKMAKQDEIPLPNNIKDWLIHVSVAKLKNEKPGVLNKIKFNVFKLLYSNAKRTDQYYGFGQKFDTAIHTITAPI